MPNPITPYSTNSISKTLQSKTKAASELFPSQSGDARNPYEKYIDMGDGYRMVMQDDGSFDYVVKPNGNKELLYDPTKEDLDKLKDANTKGTYKTDIIERAVISQVGDEVILELFELPIGAVIGTMAKGLKAASLFEGLAARSPKLTKRFSKGFSNISNSSIGKKLGLNTLTIDDLYIGAGEFLSGGIEGSSQSREEALKAGMSQEDATAYMFAMGSISALADKMNPMEYGPFKDKLDIFFKKKLNDYAVGKITAKDLIKEAGMGLVINTSKDMSKDILSETAIEVAWGNKVKDIFNGLTGSNLKKEDFFDPSTMLVTAMSVLPFSTATSARVSKKGLMSDAIRFAIDNPEQMDLYWQGRRASMGGDALDRENYWKNITDQVKQANLSKEDQAKAVELIIDRQNISLEIENLKQKYGDNAPIVKSRHNELMDVELKIDDVFDHKKQSEQNPSEPLDIQPSAAISQNTQADMNQESAAQAGPVSPTEPNSPPFESQVNQSQPNQIEQNNKNESTTNKQQSPDNEKSQYISDQLQKEGLKLEMPHLSIEDTPESKQREAEIEANNAKVKARAREIAAQYEQLPENQVKAPGDKANVKQPKQGSDEITVGEMLDKTGTYKGEKGSLYQDGQTVIFKVQGQNKEFELGNIEEIKDDHISNFDITHEDSVVSVSEDGAIQVRGVSYLNNFSNPLAAINRDTDGNIVSVNLETTDGEKRTFRSNIGEDIAYQINLKEINKNNESRKEFEQHINEDAAARKEMDSGAILEAPKKDTVKNNERIPREKINSKRKLVKDSKASTATPEGNSLSQSNRSTSPIEQPAPIQSSESNTADTTSSNKTETSSPQKVNDKPNRGKSSNEPKKDRKQKTNKETKLQPSSVNLLAVDNLFTDDVSVDESKTDTLAGEHSTKESEHKKKCK